MPPLSIMIKPVSGLCNMRCAYCFYEDVSEHRQVKSLGRMDLETLEMLIRRAFAYADGSVSFAYQGGEPTLAGLDFYRTAMRLQAKYNTRGLRVDNALQTNGLLITDEFAAFLAEHKFLVGVSLDGSRETHDALRRDAGGAGTYDRALAGIERLKAHGVPFNILCVVTKEIAERGAETFDALAPYGYMQFIPCLDGFDEAPGLHALTAEAYGEFLKVTYDRYERQMRRGKPVSVRIFDNYLQMLAGYPPELCGMRGVCGRYFLVEADGSVYPCDFYVLDEWRLGNVREDSFARLARAAVGDTFVRRSAAPDPECLACQWKDLCRGGCRRDREPFLEADGRFARNRFCAGYQAFFAHAYDRMVRLQKELGIAP